jgi:predicted DNA-binding transcriptional regulator AlpA
MNSERLLSLTETAEMLRVSTRYLQDMRKQRDFPSSVILGKVKKAYRECDIHHFIVTKGLVYSM